jgi:kynureninase
MSIQDAQALDREDSLANTRGDFYLPQDTIYLDGNSLGCLPVRARERAREVVEQQWGGDLIKSWNTHNWIDMPVTVGEKIAKLIGAAPGQTLCCDSISVNLFKLLSAALLLQRGRPVVLSTRNNFPTDLYMVQGMESFLGRDRCQLQLCGYEEMESALNEQVAVLLLSHVDFRSGQIFDMRRITEAAHAKGILVIWDLAHSAGVIPIELDACKVDFAVGCGYKYLNGGPGAPAFLYVAQRHLADVCQPLCGWMGHKAPFDFSQHYKPAEGVSRFLSGTPPVISMSVLDAALDVFEGITLAQIRNKSLALSSFFIRLIEQSESLGELSLISPREPALRGSHLAYQHSAAYAVCQALIARGVVADFRAPDILRLGFSPLYLRFVDIWHSVRVMETVFSSGIWREAAYSEKSRVT